MNKATPWLLLDCHNLLWRAFHSTGKLSYKGKGTGTTFGFFRALVKLQEQFKSDRIVFCFDSEKSLRELHFKWYKETRRQRKLTHEEEEAYSDFKDQIAKIRKDYLPRAGYLNVFKQAGFEADDLIAALTQDTNKQFVIVSSDSDLYQLLSDRTCMYDPIKDRTYSNVWFKTNYQIMPEQWAWIKAIAGCKADDIKGARGIGEKTAIKYMRGEELTARQRKILSDETSRLQENYKLTRLPYPGISMENLKVMKNEFNSKEWTHICNELGFRTISKPVNVTGLSGE
jgi:DNA polymerase I